MTPQRRLAELAPSTPLTVVEAAALAGVTTAELERHLDSGELLYETAKRDGREVRLVRVVDLREAFTAEPAPETEPEPELQSAAPPPNVSRAPHREGSTERAREPVSDTALVPLLGELRARVEEAERERRASTAGLLLAQRRLLELETAARPVPWRRRTEVWTGVCATCAVGALWLDLSGRLGDVHTAARDGQSVLSGTAARIDADVGGLETQLATLVTASERAREEAEAARRIAESRAAEEATARRVELERMEREREALAERLAELRRDAEAARATLGVERDAGARERERFAQRLDSAERDLERARAAVEQERRAAADDRAAFLAQLAELERAERERAALASSTLGGLAREVEGLRAATRRAEDAAQRLETVTRAPAGPAPAAPVDTATEPLQGELATRAGMDSLLRLFGLRPSVR
jgi:hypothetical protein